MKDVCAPELGLSCSENSSVLRERAWTSLPGVRTCRKGSRRGHSQPSRHGREPIADHLALATSGQIRSYQLPPRNANKYSGAHFKLLWFGLVCPTAKVNQYTRLVFRFWKPGFACTLEGVYRIDPRQRCNVTHRRKCFQELL